MKDPYPLSPEGKRLGRRRLSHAALRWFLIGALAFLLLSEPLALLAIGGYQRLLSPHKGWRCSYATLHGGPSCSEYAEQAVREHGLINGLILLNRRFEDCRAASATLREQSAVAARGQGSKAPFASR